MFWWGVWFLLRMRGVNPQVYASSAVREEREREREKNIIRKMNLNHICLNACKRLI